MTQILSLLGVLGPLFFGLLIPVYDPNKRKFIDQSINLSIYVILSIMGLEIARMDNLGSELFRILFYAGFFFVGIIVLNISVLAVFDRLKPWLAHQPTKAKVSGLHLIFSCSRQVIFILLGFVLGYLLPSHFHLPDNLTNYILMVLLLLIGMQIRSSDVNLWTLLFNKRGMQTTALITITSLLGAFLVGRVLGVPISQSLAMGSGMGWYSLSGGIMNTAYGPFWGSVALLNDLGREILALVIIPVLMPKYPSAAVGLGGATSLDFTLPIIKQSGGVNAALLALNFGFVISIISPVLMVFFSSTSF